MARPPTVSLAPGVWRVPLLRDFINGFIFRDDDGQVTLLDMGLARHGRKVRSPRQHRLRTVGRDPAAAHPRPLRPCRRRGSRRGRDRAQLHRARRRRGVRARGPGAADRPDVSARQVRTAVRVALVHRRRGQEELSDHQVLPIGCGLRVVHTPGHSPGHCSFLHEASGVLVTGDAIFNVFGTRWPVKSFCTDFAMTQRTAHRLGELDYTIAAFTHGPEIRDGARAAIRTFLARG